MGFTDEQAARNLGRFTSSTLSGRLGTRRNTLLVAPTRAHEVNDEGHTLTQLESRLKVAVVTLDTRLGKGRDHPPQRSKPGTRSLDRDFFASRMQ